MGSVIVLEFNELCPPVMDRFIAEGHLPNFERLRRESHQFVTDADDRPPNLEPWIQWVSLHTGMPFKEHGVFDLNEGHLLKAPRIWDLVSDGGQPVLVCGSMNVNDARGIRGAVIPDPWNTAVDPTLAELLPYFRFVQRNVHEYTNDRIPLSAMDYGKFAAFMALHGISKETVRAVVEQLASERRRPTRWRRPVILDRLQFDVFRHYYKKLRPAFSTFFINSTAHFQHLYWRNFEPEKFGTRPTPEEQERYGAAVLYGYQKMDELVARFMNLLDARSTLIFCTALSQQPYFKFENSGGKRFYRPRSFERFLEALGVREISKISPLMSQEFHTYFSNEGAAASAEDLFRSLRVDGEEAFNVSREGTQVTCGCRYYGQATETTLLKNERTGASFPLLQELYQIEGVKSGMHHPDGILWIRRPDGSSETHKEKVSILSIAPTILDMFSIRRADTMKAPKIEGFSGLLH